MKDTSSHSIRLFLVFIKRNQQKIAIALNIFFIGIKTEAKEAKEASILIHKYLKEGKLTKEEETIIKKQAADLLKIAGIGIPFVLLPGASIIIPFIVRAAEKKNIDLIPSAFRKKD
ncbi:LETM1 domain-containing protein [Flavobacteriaceae bacterium]|nr:LETM1 domain-containing protein [Flavobacteriaceae bacterium]